MMVRSLANATNLLDDGLHRLETLDRRLDEVDEGPSPGAAEGRHRRRGLGHEPLAFGPVNEIRSVPPSSFAEDTSRR